MVLDWGMSEKLGFVRYATEDGRSPWADLGGKDYSDETAEVIDAEVRAIIDQARQDTSELLRNNSDKLESLADALRKYETLDVDEVQQIVDGKKLSRPSVNDLLDAESAKPRPDNGASTEPAGDGPDATPMPLPG